MRNGRKKLGLAASADVGRLSKLISQLTDEILTRTGYDKSQLSGAILSLPSIIAIYEEDACDALDFVDIYDLVGTHIATSHPRAIAAAFAGHGYGICPDWLDPDACKDHWMKMPFYETLLVDYSRGALSVDWHRLNTAAGLGLSYESENVSVDFDAGSVYDETDEAHWERISEHIKFVIKTAPVWKSVNLVMLTGESADDEMFRRTVAAAVGKANLKIVSTDPLLTAATAASQMASRAAEVQKRFPHKRYFSCPPV